MMNEKTENITFWQAIGKVLVAIFWVIGLILYGAIIIPLSIMAFASDK